MKSSSRILLYLLPLCFVIGGVFVSFSVIEETDVYKNEKSLALNEMTLETRIANTIDEYGLDRMESMEKYEAHYERMNQARIHYDAGVTLSLYMVIGIVVFFLLMLFLFYRGPLIWQASTISTVAVAIVLLVMGIFSPMLEIVAYLEDVNVGFEIMFVELDHTWFGKMYAFHQNKSIMDVIGILFQHNNYVVAIAILLFSVVVPAMKLSLTVLVVINNKVRHNKAIVWLVNNIGKWSMADVMVVSILLAMLALNSMSTGIELETTALLGLYFFLSYVIVAIISSMLLKRAIKEIDGEQTGPVVETGEAKDLQGIN
jgi:hypothetical protein